MNRALVLFHFLGALAITAVATVVALLTGADHNLYFLSAASGCAAMLVPLGVYGLYAIRPHPFTPTARQILMEGIIATTIKYMLIIFCLGFIFKFTSCTKIIVISAFVAMAILNVIAVVCTKKVR
ncbi:MAG: hypothetical protein K6A65_02390 [Succinivibrionaceae bacterium]|nr:hypothetical protein [Succinivibrionaceae bacterium]